MQIAKGIDELVVLIVVLCLLLFCEHINIGAE